MKTLIAYFSHSGENWYKNGLKNLNIGNCEILAKDLQESIGGDIFRIETKNVYPSGYYDCCNEAKKEIGKRPELKEILKNVSDYQKILLVYPIWWGTCPMAVFTFLESFDTSGKEIVLFATHEGSGFAESEMDVKKSCPKAIISRGFEMNGYKIALSKQYILDFEKKME